MLPPHTTHKRTGFTDALDAFFGGIFFIVTTPRIWPLALIPALVVTVLWSVGAVLGIWGAVELSNYVLAAPKGAWAIFAHGLLTVLLGAVAVLVAALVALALAQPLSGPALERISIAQQRRLKDSEPPSPGLLKSMWSSFKALALALGAGGAAFSVLIALNLLFPPAVIVTVPLKFLVGAWMLAWDCLDYPFGLRGVGVRARLRWVRHNAGAFTVFGLLLATVTVVPGAILLLLPVGAAGATRLILKDDPNLEPSQWV